MNQIPELHHEMTISLTDSYLYLYGFHGWDGTARFTVVRNTPGVETEVIFDHAEWKDVYPWATNLDLHRRNGSLNTSEFLHNLVPPMTDWYREQETKSYAR